MAELKNILIVGSGAREHCIADILSENPDNRVFVLRGNQGMKYLTPKLKLIDTDQNQDSHIIDICIKKNISYVVIGSEVDLQRGLTDLLLANKIPVIGPTQKAAEIETSKVFSKKYMESVFIPTASFSIYDLNSLKRYVERLRKGLPFEKFEKKIQQLVFKVDGLAFGKGVFLPANAQQLEEILYQLDDDKTLSIASKQIIVEERIIGKEFSMMCFCDGKEVLFMPHSKDYKKIGSDDTGPNTGGMGSVSNVVFVEEKSIEKLKESIKKFVFDYQYKGILYPGCIIEETTKKTHVLEFNARFGDPEVQSVLRHFSSTQLTDIFDGIISGNLTELKPVIEEKIKKDNRMFLSFVLSHQDYPQKKAEKYFPIDLPKIKEIVEKYMFQPKLYSASIHKMDGEYKTNGGRILTISCCYDGFINNISTIGELKYKQLLKNYLNFHHMLSKIDYSGIYFRHDIGRDVLFEAFEKTDFSHLKKYNIALLCSGNASSGEEIIFDNINRCLKSNYRQAIPFEIGEDCDFNIIHSLTIITNKTEAGVLQIKKRYIDYLTEYKEKELSPLQKNCIQWIDENFNKWIDIRLIDDKKYSKQDYHKLLIEELLKNDIHYIFLVGYMKIIPSSILDMYRGRVFNIHPSLLPKYKNMMDLQIHRSVIANKEKYSGATLHIVEQRVDEGLILLQERMEVKTQNASQLKKDIQMREKKLLRQFIKMLAFYDYQTIFDKPEKPPTPLTYTHAGVDIDVANQFVDRIKNHLKNTSKQNPDTIGGFSGVVTLDDGKRIVACTDGVGTKLELARQYNTYSGIGIDLVAMCVNDLLTRGAKPLFFLDYYAMNQLQLPIAEKIIESIIEGCQQADMLLLGGETAEMPMVYERGKFDMAGFCVGILPAEASLYPLKKEIRPDDFIYALPSSGLHSNGYSLVHKLIEKQGSISIKWIEDLLKPTRIYYREVERMKKKFGKHLLAMAHITGGGLVENIPRVLNKNQSFELQYNWPIPNIFKYIYQKSDMSVYDMYKTYNLGIGMIFVVSQHYKDEFDEREESFLIGKIITTSKPILIETIFEK